METATQIANNIEILSPEHRIIRYVVKMWRNRANSEWLADKNIKKVMSNGKLVKNIVRQHFIDRGILTGAEFDSAIQRGVSANILTNDLSKCGPTLIQVADILDARQTAENEEAQAQRDATRLAALPTAERDALAINYSARTLEILATK